MTEQFELSNSATYRIDEYGNAINANGNTVIDGRIGKADTNKAVEVLFILKESGSADELLPRYFWFKDRVVESNGKTGKKYFNVLRLLLKSLSEQKTDISDDLENCAYINLNKLGGGPKETKAYRVFWQQKEKLLLQIERLAPEYIICLGNYDNVCKLLAGEQTDESCFWYKERKMGVALANIGEDAKKVRLYEFFHPSYGFCYEYIDFK